MKRQPLERWNARKFIKRTAIFFFFASIQGSPDVRQRRLKVIFPKRQFKVFAFEYLFFFLSLYPVEIIRFVFITRRIVRHQFYRGEP